MRRVHVRRRHRPHRRGPQSGAAGRSGHGGRHQKSGPRPGACPKGNIYEWDFPHGTVEKCNKRGKHLGEYDPTTVAETKPAAKSREVAP
ncbi:colicin E3/pyocin S6 family cytotoxin [Streptomyces huasconensis]|uniref:colicin E3/pyocin S6 family cytotoxin n=1 Tax=Streptomyces TaxID=1883 RepID=UPI0038B66BF0|nr:hypothetical protein J2N69_02860 [Streptomyces huasconensis]